MQELLQSACDDAMAGDWSSCLVYADWLEEQGDPTAAGWRWLAENEKRPRVWAGYRVVSWLYRHAEAEHQEYRIDLSQLTASPPWVGSFCRDYILPLPAFLDAAQAITAAPAAGKLAPNPSTG